MTIHLRAARTQENKNW